VVPSLRNGFGDRNSFTDEMGIAVIVSANNPGVNGPVFFWLEPVSVRHPATWEFTREHCFNALPRRLMAAILVSQPFGNRALVTLSPSAPESACPSLTGTT
jgi:hypothetical protein